LLNGIEWVFYGLIALVIFVWGADKIPVIARTLSRASQELRTASQELGKAALTEPNTPSEKSKDMILIETAHNLGVATQGKTRKQVTEEINTKIKELRS